MSQEDVKPEGGIANQFSTPIWYQDVNKRRKQPSRIYTTRTTTEHPKVEIPKLESLIEEAHPEPNASEEKKEATHQLKGHQTSDPFSLNKTLDPLGFKCRGCSA